MSSVTRFLPGALLLAALVGGCNGQPDPRQGETKSLPHGKMTISDELPPIEKVVPTSPRKAVLAYQQALGYRDWGKCWALLSKPTKQVYHARAAEFRETLVDLIDGPQTIQAEEALRDTGHTLAEARHMTGKMMMIGMHRKQLKNNPEEYRAFVEAVYVSHQQMGRVAVVQIRMRGHEHPKPVMTASPGALWYIVVGRPNPGSVVRPGLLHSTRCISESDGF